MLFDEGELEVTDISLSYTQTRDRNRFQLIPAWQFSVQMMDAQKEVHYYDVYYRLEDAVSANQVWRVR